MSFRKVVFIGLSFQSELVFAWIVPSMTAVSALVLCVASHHRGGHDAAAMLVSRQDWEGIWLSA